MVIWLNTRVTKDAKRNSGHVDELKREVEVTTSNISCENWMKIFSSLLFTDLTMFSYFLSLC